MRHNEIADRDEFALRMARHLVGELVPFIDTIITEAQAGQLRAMLQSALRASVDWGADRPRDEVRPDDLAHWSADARQLVGELQVLVGKMVPAVQVLNGDAARDAVLKVGGYVSDIIGVRGPHLHQSDEVFLPKHADDRAVDRTATAMKIKLAEKRMQGRGGWEDKAQCTREKLSQMLRQHVEKGDPLDVANFAMMLFQRGEKIA